jgi:hypothetical protein
MKVIVITEVDLTTGQYEITFRNGSEPGMPMDLAEIKRALLRVTDDFCSDSVKEAGPEQMLS